MNITDVENLANLARIELSEVEKKELLSDMKGILDYVKQIEEVNLPKAGFDRPVKARLWHANNVWREDKLEPRDFSKELILEQFPDKQDGFLKVKKIL
ncbi:MAG: Asp-tRNA(Asn)/Glu-tRNA(Gln) amidotransferase subunit GatC [Patescibacteria group bacterium]